MNTTLLLAQADAPAPLQHGGANPVDVLREAFHQRIDLLDHPDKLIPALHQIHPVWAGLFVVVGALFLINGFRWHKGIIILLSAGLGAVLGMWVGDRMGGARIAAGASLAVLFAILALPGLRFAAALFGGLAGAFFGANAWTAFGGDPALHQVGSLIGLLVLGMLAFISFRLVIVMLTAIGGGTLVVLGGLALTLQVGSWDDSITRSLNENHLILPLIVAVAAAISVVVQQGGGVKGLYAAADKHAPKKAPKPA